MSLTSEAMCVALIFGVACIVIGTWPKPRNRRVTLPPPSEACKRPGVEAAPNV